jgi:hypothetical protein
MSNKPIVRIIKNWKKPDLMRQTPQNKGIWSGIQFTTESVKECDYVLVLNYVPKNIQVHTSQENIWAMMQEPYLPGIFDWMEVDHSQFNRVFTHHIFNDDSKYLRTQTCLPWHIDRSYDELIACKPPQKKKKISWVTTSKSIFPGHKDRMRFFNTLKTEIGIGIDIFGYGINPIKDKWNGIYPYKYSLAIENSSTSDYWTEKISDCYLAFTLPIYYGCTNIKKYFPSESFVKVDINDTKKSIETIKKVLEEDIWESRLEAIKEARELVLNRYQLFPFIASQINIQNNPQPAKRTITLKAYDKFTT